MRLVVTAWYLFGLLLFSTPMASAITYAPAAQNMANRLLGASAVLAGVFGMGATWLTITRKRNPDSRIFRSKLAFLISASVAAIMTFILVVGVIG